MNTDADKHAHTQTCAFTHVHILAMNEMKMAPAEIHPLCWLDLILREDDVHLNNAVGRSSAKSVTLFSFDLWSQIGAY